MEFQSSGAGEVSEMVCGGEQAEDLMAAGGMTLWCGVRVSRSLV